MDLKDRKAQIASKINDLDEAIITEIEQLIISLSENKLSLTSYGMTREKLVARVNESELDFQKGNVKSAEDLLKKYGE
ncbi:MAG: hypothetical protein NWQ55_10140 [Salibacteraceae bacterium]|jgi:hypothetical protein|nr:hypothetical protein [Salibacteraceae bacterium]MDP4965424.1 hypothetical protein [Salibacteraceae bacterium]